MSGKRYLTVTALTRYMKAKLENDVHLQSVLLKGEISNFKYHSRGHMYFTLKDENARISAVMFAGNNRTIRFNPEDGMTVLVQGDISLYETAGNYQLYIKEMQPDGIGHLHLAYEQLKKKLEEEGLFSSLYKIQLPKYPQCIGVITSPTGAAVRDILTTINRRYPLAKVVVFPTLVQGDQAAPSIVKSIKKANDLGYVDVIIAGRGGGSIEELWAFNEEIVARAIHESIVPIISAVGHETDFTIADFVADLRAPTPTAAAEMAVPSKVELMEKIQQQSFRIQQSINRNIQDKKHRLASLQQSYAFRYPQQLHAQKEQELDRLLDRLHKSMADMYREKSNGHQQQMLRLQQHHPHQKIERAKVTFGHMEKDLQRALHKIIQEKQHRFSTVISQLETLSPLSIMNRGYSLAYNDKKQLVKSVEDTQVGDLLTIQVQDGNVACRVSSIEERVVSHE